LPSVFHAGAELFVTPSGGRMDEIIRAARHCPSGALSYAIDGREARDQVDQVDQANREPAIEVSKDGPYRITGEIPLLNGQGEPEPRAAGASMEHYSLCRCGQSKNKPFCRVDVFARWVDAGKPE
jgi:Iron-binding zinc finger CDGSH type/Divergent 4Fe-4S mono-cluster